MPNYAELHCHSAFSFLCAAAMPEDLVARAAELGYAALALTDECSFAGAVRAHLAAKKAGLPLIHGSSLTLDDGLRLVLLVRDREGWGNLCQRITLGRQRAGKGGYRLTRADLLVDGCGLPGCLVLWRPDVSEMTAAVSPGMSPPGRTHSARSAPRGASRPVRGSEPSFPAQPDSHALRAAKLGAAHRFLESAVVGAKVSPVGTASLADAAHWLRTHFAGRVWIAAERLLAGDDEARLAALGALAARYGLPLVATGDVRMVWRRQRRLLDLLTAIRLGKTLDSAGLALQANGERHLRPRERLARLFPAEWLAETIKIASLCRFSLDELRDEYPEEIVPAGLDAAAHLRAEVEEGARRRYARGVPASVRAQIEHELALIGELAYEPYFLTVHDLVRFARGRGILCQGRGSAANSAVCYCLGITEVDPARQSMLFERFVSKERGEPPDIDVDFEHERREEVIQYLYRKYGRQRVALAATVIRYRARSALRDAGRAFGFDEAAIARLTARLGWWDEPEFWPQALAEAGFDAEAQDVRLWLTMAQELIGLPRHLSQHVGGFVISRDRLDRLVPIENARMAGRSVIQWDKGDIDALGWMKVDVLALGMLSALRRALAVVSEKRGVPFGLGDIPPEDPAVYEMLARGDAIGVFQIESRAQLAMLPRLQPRCFYDLVIEVAIVRPGPIQGQMVHPYLRRRAGQEAVTYPNAAVRAVLERTLGVPIFQEQAMQLAIVGAGFTPGEADQLRRAMAAWRRQGGLAPFRDRLIDGMRARGITPEFAEHLYRQIEGFADYGFPESHAASFALLVYASAWLKRHEPAALLIGLLDSQPMGFYAPSQLVQDARRHGVTVLPPDVQHSDWQSRLEDGAVRLGLRLVKGLGEEAGRRIAARQPYADLGDLAHRAALGRHELGVLARAGTLAALAGHRHQAAWQALGIDRHGDLLDAAQPTMTGATKVSPVTTALAWNDAEAAFAGVALTGDATTGHAALAPPDEGQELRADYAYLGLTLGSHPLALLRPRLDARYRPSSALRHLVDRRPARVVGLVSGRQRPATAKGTVFVTLEDEDGLINVIVPAEVAARQRNTLLTSRLLGVLGTLRRQGEVIHVLAQRLVDHGALLQTLDGSLAVPSRDFR